MVNATTRAYLRAKACAAAYGHMHVTGDVMVALLDALDAAERELRLAKARASEEYIKARLDLSRQTTDEVIRERDALAALLRDCRDECEAWTPDESLATADESDALNGWYALRDRIDAALDGAKEKP